MDIDFEDLEKIMQEDELINKTKKEKDKKEYKEKQREKTHDKNKNKKKSRSRSKSKRKDKKHSKSKKKKENKDKKSSHDQTAVPKPKSKEEIEEEIKKQKQQELVQAKMREIERRIKEQEKEIDEARREDLTLLIYCLPLRAKEKDIYQFFQMNGCGRIHDIRIIRDQRSGKSKGVAYVEFFEEQSLTLALSLHEKLFIMDGKECPPPTVKISLSFAEKNRMAQGTKKVKTTGRQYLEMVDLETPGPVRVQITGLVDQLTELTETDLRQTFEAFGSIDNVEIQLDNNGRHQGIAYVTFSKGIYAKNAIEAMNNFVLRGRTIKVQAVPLPNQVMISELNMDLDDEYGHLYLNDPLMRLQLMKKLLVDEPEPTSIQLPPILDDLGLKVQNIMAALQSGNPYLGSVSGWKPFNHPIPHCPLPTRIVVLTNIWTEEELRNPIAQLEVKDDVETEVKKFGDIGLVWIDLRYEGYVWVVVRNIITATEIQRNMNNRKFNDRQVYSYFVTETQFITATK